MGTEIILQTPQQNLSLEQVRKITENGIIPVEKRAVVANQCPKISDDTSDTEIKQFIVYAMALIGFPPERFPDDNEKLLLVNSIRAEMRHYSLEELRLAFSFAVSRKFIVDLRFYADSRFSFEYIARVISAYDKYTAEMIAAELRRLKSEQFMKDTEIKKYTAEELIEQGKSHFEFILRTLQETKNYPLIADYTLVLRYLEHEGKINDSKKFKKIFFEKVKSDLVKEAQSAKPEGRRGDFDLRSEIKKIQRGDIKTECRKRRVKRYIDKLIKKQLIKTEDNPSPNLTT